MRFERQLREKFVGELNRLYSDQESWWHKIVEDEKGFILIRENRIHILINGGRLLQVEFSFQGALKCQAHEDFLSLRNMANPYVQMTEDSSPEIERVKGLRGLAEHYQKVKNRVKLFTEREKQVVQDLGAKHKQIIDLEIGLEGEHRPDASKKGSQRVDMAVVSEDGTLVFFEVKLLSNPELRSQLDKTPAVVNQLKKYESLLQKYMTDISNGYKSQFKIYGELKGRFFSQRRRLPVNLKCYPTVRLIITDFDGVQRKHLLPVIEERIKDRMGWEEKSNDLIAVGDHQKIRMELLLKGI